MKRFSAGLLALVACFLTQSNAFGQMQPGNYHGNQGGSSSAACESCQISNYQSSPVYQTCDTCDGGGSSACSFWTRPLFPNSCAAKCCATKAYPDAGWTPPARLPVNYDGAWYGAYVPQHAYGTPGGGFVANYPTVYQPTDTTQMGYYYHKVPTWQTRNDKIPGIPRPSDFHTRTCPGNGSGCFGHHGGYAVPVNSNCQNWNSGNYATMAPAQTTPSARYVVRPSAPKSQSFLSKISLTSMTEIFD